MSIYLETTEAEALEIVLKHGYTDKKLINDRLMRFKWSSQTLKEFVLTLGGAESVDTGGGYCVSFLELANGDVLAVNGIRACIYPNEEASVVSKNILIVVECFKCLLSGSGHITSLLH